MSGIPAPASPESDKIGLTCAACHTGSIRYQDVSIRFDGGAAMLELRKLESASGLAIFYTLIVPGRFDRFADRVLGPGAGKAQRDELKKSLQEVGDFLKNQIEVTEKTLKAKGQKDTDEGYGRLDALEPDRQPGLLHRSRRERSCRLRKQPARQRCARQLPAGLDRAMALVGAVRCFDRTAADPQRRRGARRLRAWSICHPTIRRKGFSVRPSPWKTSVRIEAMLRGPDPFGRNPKAFSGLIPPKWPAHLFPNDDAWKIKPDRVAKGRALYAEICAECHLGPVSDPAFDTQFPDKSFWASKRWKQDPKGSWMLDEVQKQVGPHGNGPGAGQRAADAAGSNSRLPRPAAGARSRRALEVQESADLLLDQMPFSIALMIVVDKVSQKWLKDNDVKEPALSELWGERSNCPNPRRRRRSRSIARGR